MEPRNAIKLIQLNRHRPAYFLPIVIGSVVIGTAVRVSLIPFLGPTGAPYVVYFIAVFISASLLGFRSGAFASLLCILAAVIFFLRPTGDHGQWKPTQFFDLGIVFIEWLIISLLGHAQLVQRERADSKQAQLIEIQNETRRQVERATSLNIIGKAIRERRSPKEIYSVAIPELANTLNVDRAFILTIDYEQGLITLASEWHVKSLPSLMGAYKIEDFKIDDDQVFQNGSSLVVNDVAKFEIFPQKLKSLLHEMSIKAILHVPLEVNGELNSLLSVCMTESPRTWNGEEISYVEALASLLKSAVEAHRLLNDTQKMAEREALINRISDEIRTSQDPESVQERAVTILGKALGADRCYFAAYDLAAGEVTVSKDYRRPDLPTIRGVHHFRNTNAMFNELYGPQSTSVIVDRYSANLSSETLENMQKLQIRSRISVAIGDSKGMMTLTACMSDTPREWTEDNSQIMKRVAQQLRISIEMARIQAREHRIAADLQAALLPPLPKITPGLQVTSSMHPALDEAEIGGDFYDVFSLNQNLTVLVIGDVSGKGLAAAGQLAMVRNCLRMSFYQYQQPNAALTELNKIIAATGHHSGFVTVFAMLYNSATCELTYSSCGHEPAFLRRAKSNDIEMLHTAGLPLGVTEDYAFTQLIVKIEQGDLLLAYTDGLVEAGPTRQQMIETDGLADFFAKININSCIEDISDQIVRFAKDSTGGPLRDDLCILLAKACR